MMEDNSIQTDPFITKKYLTLIINIGNQGAPNWGGFPLYCLGTSAQRQNGKYPHQRYTVIPFIDY